MTQVIEIVPRAKVMEQACLRPPFGPGFDPTIAANADHMEILGSGFKDPGGDYCLFILRDQDGQELARRRLEGY
jgi:hypothetical protein